MTTETKNAEVVAPPTDAASTIAQLQAELAALKAKEAKLSSKEVAAKPVTKAKKAKAVKAEKPKCKFEGCINKTIALGLCPSHYRQHSRNQKLVPLREVGRGLVRLPMVIRVTPETFKSLKKRIKLGLARSMYDATRQALEAGIAGWPKE
jgi:hypothetical protein